MCNIQLFINMVLAHHCNTFFKFDTWVLNNYFIFQISLWQPQKEIYEISTINIGDFFVKFSELLTPNIINYETFYNIFYFYLFVQKWRDILFNQSGHETVFFCVPVPQLTMVVSSVAFFPTYLLTTHKQVVRRQVIKTALILNPKPSTYLLVTSLPTYLHIYETYFLRNWRSR